MRSRSVPLRFGGLTLLASLVGCVPPSEEAPTERSFEELFSSRASVAEKIWNGVLVSFGTPEALPLLDDGWSYGEATETGETFRWTASSRASFRFHSDHAGEFLAFITCEPFQFEGSPAQWMQPTINGTELPAIELRSGRDSYPVPMVLQEGENRIEWQFRYAGAPRGSGTPDGRDLAVAFYRFDVDFERGSESVGLPRPFGWVTLGDGRSGTFVPAGGALRVSARVPRGARLRVTAGAREPATLRLTDGAALQVSAALGKDDLLGRALVASGPEMFLAEIDEEIPPSAELLTLTLRAETRGVWTRAELVAPRFDDPSRVETEAGASARDALARELLEKDANLLVVVLDGANALRTNLLGYERETTPALRKLGEQSVVFETAVSQAVYTIASIGSLFTGQYPERHRGVSFAARLPDDAVTLPEILRDAGFETAAFSGNAVVSKTYGLEQGFDTFEAVWEREDYTGHGDSVVQSFREWMKGQDGERFFAYVHFREPHFPYNPPPPFDTRFGPAPVFPDGLADATVVDRYNDASARGVPPPEEVSARIRTLYEGNLAYADALLRELLELLEARGHRDDTVIIVTADHGEALFEHGFLGHNTQLYEESIRIPLVVHIPGHAPRRVQSLVELLDLMPTILDLFAADQRDRLGPTQGTSLVPFLTQRSDPRSRERHAFVRTLWDQPRYALRSSDHKFVWDSRSGARELYHLLEDPREARNLVDSASHARMAGYYRQELLYWLQLQERLRSHTPDVQVDLTEDERRVLESLDYTDHLPARSRKR